TLAAAAASLRGLAEAVEAEHNPPPVSLGWSGSALLPSATRGSAASEDAVALDRAQAAALVDRIAEYAALGVATARGLETGRDAPEVEGIENAPPPLPAFAQLRAILTPDSLVLRYALRVGLATTIAVALAAALGLRRDYWVTITVVIILQPYTGATSQKALQRLLGTVVGGILAALLGAWFHQPAAILALAFGFVTCCVALLPVNYAVFSVFVTPAFVLLAEASAGDWHLAEVRIVNTAIGGTLALLAARLFWPTPESSRLPAYMAAALAANRDYLRLAATLARDGGPVNPAPLREARRAVGLAATNAEESFQRLLGEHRGPAEDLEPWMTFLTFTRRFAASVAALALARVPPDAASLEAIPSFAEAATRAFDDLITAVTAGQPPEPLPTAALEPLRVDVPPVVRARLDRLARQLKSLHDAVAHGAERQGPARAAGSPS
ncbi:MAG TPA: FUSC family protein, partial [Vicinamibacteria bacterium]|nr:FUSC family protein [Vicinamibacteria bacterium]